MQQSVFPEAHTTKPNAFPISDLLGASRLAIEATSGITKIVETMHRQIASAPLALDPQVAPPIQGITALVYQSIQAITGLVGSGIEAVLAPMIPLSDEAVSSPQRQAALAALNGVLGDHLAATGNPLAISMCLRRDGQPLVLQRQLLAQSIPGACGRLLVLAHGLCMGDLQWSRMGHDHGSVLARDLGLTPVYLLYNSGLHVSENGRMFAAMMKSLMEQWPVEVQEIVFIGHSMGGLVIRSALHYAEADCQWRQHVRKVVFLGTPHHGSPLERAGNWINLALDVSPYTTALAGLGRVRSAGITDLRFGNVLDEDWQGHGQFDPSPDRRLPVPLPADIECYAIAANAGKPIADGLVPVDSALGRHSDSARTLAFPPSHQWIAQGTGHFDLLNDPATYDQIRRWLG